MPTPAIQLATYPGASILIAGEFAVNIFEDAWSGKGATMGQIGQ